MKHNECILPFGSGIISERITHTAYALWESSSETKAKFLFKKIIEQKRNYKWR